MEVNLCRLDGKPRDSFYLDETLADVAGAQGLVAAEGQGQSREEEEESGGGREDQLSRPHPDGSPARHWKHLHQHETQGQGAQRSGTEGKDK